MSEQDLCNRTRGNPVSCLCGRPPNPSTRPANETGLRTDCGPRNDAPRSLRSTRGRKPSLLNGTDLGPPAETQKGQPGLPVNTESTRIAPPLRRLLWASPSSRNALATEISASTSLTRLPPSEKLAAIDAMFGLSCRARLASKSSECQARKRPRPHCDGVVDRRGGHSAVGLSGPRSVG